MLSFCEAGLAAVADVALLASAGSNASYFASSLVLPFRHVMGNLSNTSYCAVEVQMNNITTYDVSNGQLQLPAIVGSRRLLQIPSLPAGDHATLTLLELTPEGALQPMRTPGRRRLLQTGTGPALGIPFGIHTNDADAVKMLLNASMADFPAGGTIQQSSMADQLDVPGLGLTFLGGQGNGQSLMGVSFNNVGCCSHPKFCKLLHPLALFAQ